MIFLISLFHCSKIRYSSLVWCAKVNKLFIPKVFVLFVFYSEDVENDRGTLAVDEIHHCIHVLRHKVGDTIFVANGKGKLYTCLILSIQKSLLRFEVVKIVQLPVPGLKTGIAMAFNKSMERMEWLVEKSVELGVSNIYFFDCQRAERSKVNVSKLYKVAISAMKQSRHGYLPEILVCNNVANLITETIEYEQKFAAVCVRDQAPLSSVLNQPCKRLTVVGPEGDFTNEEIQLLSEAGFQAVSLGPTILRSETAGMVAATLLKLL